MAPRKPAHEGRRRAAEESPREGQFIQPVGPSTDQRAKTRRASRPRHAAAEPVSGTPHRATAKPAKAAPKKTAPSAPVSGPPRSPRSPRSRGDAGHVVSDEAREYARRQALRATTAKPSVVGRGAAGAAAGAGTGAALGSVVPGVGTAVGAGVGTALGGAGGAISGAKAKKNYKQAMRGSGGGRRIIVIEFIVCMVVAALSPLTDKHRDEPPGAFMKRMTAIMGLFFILALVSAGGRGAAKAAAGLGGLVTVALFVSNRSLFGKLAAMFNSTDDQPASGTGPDVESPRVGRSGTGPDVESPRVGRRA